MTDPTAAAVEAAADRIVAVWDSDPAIGRATPFDRTLIALATTRPGVPNLTLAHQLEPDVRRREERGDHAFDIAEMIARRIHDEGLRP